MKKIYTVLLILTIVFSYGQTKQFKLVLDAGHGGKDSGAKKNGCIEKEIALDVILQIGAILEKYPEFQILYSRKTDEFIPLRTRANNANDFKADLFVSVHCNASPSPTPFGSMTLVMGQQRSKMNFDVAKSENSVIFQEEDYKEKYENFDPNNPQTQIGLKLLQEETLLQSIEFASELQNKFKNTLKRKSFGMHQQPLWVLDATVMPGVLIELGFLTNYKESQYMNSKEGRSNYAQIIAQNIIEYKNKLQETNLPLFETNFVEPVILEPVIETPKTDTSIAVVSSPITDTNIATSTNNVKEIVNNAPKTEVSTPIIGNYRVQLYFSKYKTDIVSTNFKGLDNITMSAEKNGYKYYYGNAKTMEEAKELQKFAKKKGYKSTFIVEVK
jgi:N-acetylmuramoyl-L-alanine amidase